MDNKIIQEKMKELSTLIDFNFKNIEWLVKAMNAKKYDVEGEGKNHKEYANDTLATVGDAVLKLVVSNYLYNEKITKRGIDRPKEEV